MAPEKALPCEVKETPCDRLGNIRELRNIPGRSGANSVHIETVLLLGRKPFLAMQPLNDVQVPAAGCLSTAQENENREL
jgi:hypothetical protein